MKTEDRNRIVAERILRRLESQDFADWYAGEFDDYITGRLPKGHPKRPTKRQVLESVKEMFLSSLLTDL